MGFAPEGELHVGGGVLAGLGGRGLVGGAIGCGRLGGRAAVGEQGTAEQDGINHYFLPPGSTAGADPERSGDRTARRPVERS